MGNRRTEARVSLQGPEVAKWLANRGPAWSGAGLPVGVAAATANGGVVLDLNNNPFGLATLDDDAYVEFVAYDLADANACELAKAALEAVSAATDGLPERATCLQVAIEAL